MADIEIDGKRRRLVYNYNAVADAEKETGMGFGAMMSEDRIGFDTIRTLLWAGMKSYEHGLTLQRAGMLIDKYLEDGGKIEDMMVVIFKAVQESKMFAKSGNVEAGGE